MDAFGRWWQEHSADLSEPSAAAKAFDAVVREGLAELPLPGSGRTGDRFALLAAFGAADLTLARLVEGHADAVAILDELGEPALTLAERAGVWAAEPPNGGVRAQPGHDGAWRLSGVKQWCSGASTCTRALVTARTEVGPQLFSVDLSAPGVCPQPGRWSADGMAGSDTEAVRFDAVPARPVGRPDQYVQRPGFWFGAIGVAAVWWGGAGAVARPLARAAGSGRADPHSLAHLGAVSTALAAGGALLASAAAQIDGNPAREMEAEAFATRAAVEGAATTTLDRVGRALGPGPLAVDRSYARHVVDLTVYLRQSHAERDLARLGTLVGRDDAW